MLRPISVYNILLISMFSGFTPIPNDFLFYKYVLQGHYRLKET